MTKKQEKTENSKHRGSWFGVNPQTKIVPNKKKERNKNSAVIFTVPTVIKERN